MKLPESTVHRLLARRGLMKKQPDDPTSKDRRRFEYESAGDLWMSDVMFGPKIRDSCHQRQTYIIAFIDDATRVVPISLATSSVGSGCPAKSTRARSLPKHRSSFRSRCRATPPRRGRPTRAVRRPPATSPARAIAPGLSF